MLDHYFQYVESFFRSRNIWSPPDLCLDELAAENHAVILRKPRKSHAILIELEPNQVQYLCVIDTRRTPMVQRVHTAHELAHVILHYGDQSDMPDMYRLHQEAQAKRLAGHIFAPDYLLCEYIGEAPPYYEAAVTYLARVFGVTRRAMKARLDEFRSGSVSFVRKMALPYNRMVIG
ncbi:MAG: ImmA/IrrE family metallo-endopeptidase [Alicyclobacillus sp.]|nr:ImmA/IrrE family metallo-endopeptidase [Alicyclobacillus sp.]